jgi:hypothetical protein
VVTRCRRVARAYAEFEIEQPPKLGRDDQALLGAELYLRGRCQVCHSVINDGTSRSFVPLPALRGEESHIETPPRAVTRHRTGTLAVLGAPLVNRFSARRTPPTQSVGQHMAPGCGPSRPYIVRPEPAPLRLSPDASGELRGDSMGAGVG